MSGVNVQAYSDNLSTFAAIAPSANVQSLLGSVDYASVRTQLGLGSLALLGSINDSNWSGTALAITNGGTNATSALGAAAALGSFVSVKAPPYSATGNGVTDDRVAIQAAVDAVSAAGGGVVYLPPGIYAITRDVNTASGVLLPNNVTLAGAGAGASVLLCTGTPNYAGIQSSSAAADASQATQNAGNTNIHVKDLTVRFSTTTASVGIGVSFGGVHGGSITRVAVENIGGYSIYLARNNDSTTPDSEGRTTENITVSDCCVSGFVDVGIELSGAVNCAVSNCVINGPGNVGGTGLGVAAYVWNGSQNCVISGVVVRGDIASSKVVALGLADYSGSNTAVRKTKQILFVDCVGYNLFGGFTTSGNVAFAADSAVVNGRFFGKGTSDTVGIRATFLNRMMWRGGMYSNFDYTVAVSSPSDTIDQLSCAQLAITDATLETYSNGTGAEIYGVTSLDFSRNRIIGGYAFGVKFFGCKDVSAHSNQGYNVGTSGNSPLLFFTTGAGSTSRISQYISAIGNRIYDDRGTSALSNTVVLLGSTTDNAIATGNDASGGKSGASAVSYSGSSANVIIVGNSNGASNLSGPLTLNSAAAGYFEGVELGSSPAAPPANSWRLYAKDNGSGKTVLYVRFASGAEQQIAIEP